MYKRVLLAVDLEGVNNVTGEPYMGLARDTDGWKVAKEQAAAEINAAAKALFEAGAEKVGVWDNHGGGNNIDPAKLDGRIILINADVKQPRMQFADGEYDCICFFGYHCMEGTLGGVLAHTMNSKAVQYYKVNGSYVGEVDIDAYIAASKGMPSRFFSGGNIACAQAKRAVDSIVTVETKTELERNKALFRDNGELFSEIGEKIVNAVSKKAAPLPLRFPAIIEKSFKRVEDAAKYLMRLQKDGLPAEYPADSILGRDAHTVTTFIKNIDEFIKCI